jgi:tRNA threonylcarbamoyladenosine biosynthesis protein TsaB
MAPRLVEAGAAQALPGRSWTATGSGFDTHAWLRDSYRESVAMRVEGDLPRAGAVARIASRRLAQGVAAERAAPLYLRDKVALTSEERRQAKR